MSQPDSGWRSPLACHPARGRWLRFALLLGCMLGSLCLTHGVAQAQQIVNKIVITNVGPAAASEALVRANIKAKPGEPYSRAVADEDVRTLYTTGFFLNIRVAEERTPDGVNLIYVLQGKPKLMDIVFSGNKKFSASKLRKKITSKIGAPLDERKLFSDSQEIKKLYQKSGYSQTDVRYTISIDEPLGRGVATFEIKETPRVRISTVYFDNAHAFTQKKLRKVVKTRKRWMFSWLTGSGTLKDEQLEDDKERLGDFYRNEGYIDFELKDVRYVWLSPSRLELHFVVSEGNRYRVGAITFKGVSLFTTNELRRVLTMGVGSVFTPNGLTKDIDALQDLYGNKGYIDTRIGARKTANTQTGTMDLSIEIDEGEKSYIEKIEIKGNDKTKDRVIRRELAVSPGEVFDMTRVKLSKQRLEGTALFERVDSQPEPTDVPNRKNLVLSITEAQTGHLSFGAGFSSIDNILGFVEYRENNFQLPWFRGGGQKLRVRASIGALRREYDLTFVEPWFLGKKLEFSADFYHRELDYVSLDELYNEVRTGTRFGFRRALGSDFLIGGVNYTLENVSINDVRVEAPPTIQAEKGDRLVSKFGTSLAYDTRKFQTDWAKFMPVGGQQTELRTELAGGPFSGDTDFYKLDLGQMWYFKGLLRGHIFEIGGRVGTISAYNGSDRVPFYDRYFLGGLDTLRGYRYRQVGPREVSSYGAAERIGGGTYWFGTAEYSVPVIQFLRLAAFYDVGMVYPDAWSFAEDKITNTGFYNDNWGVGIRLNIPRIGPLRLDYGIPITSDPHNGGSGRFQFSFGYTREF